MEKNKLEKAFLDFGFDSDDYEYFIDTIYGYLYCSDEYLNSDKFLEKFKGVMKLLLSIGVPLKDIKGMTEGIPFIFDYGIEDIKQKIRFLISLGYTREDILKMSSNNRDVYAYSIDSIKQLIEDLISLGYTREEALTLMRDYDSLFCEIWDANPFWRYIEQLNKEIETTESLGYTRGEPKCIIRKTYNIDRVKKSIEDLISFGYTREEATTLLKSSPYDFFDCYESSLMKMIRYMESLGYTKEDVTKLRKMLDYMLSFPRNIKDMKSDLLTLDNLSIKNTKQEKEELIQMYNYEQSLDEIESGRAR